MSWYSALLKQQVLYWEPPTRDGFGGYVWGQSSCLSCRIENRGLISYSPDGTEIPSKASVWTKDDVVIGGYMWLDGCDDPTVDDNFDPGTDASQIASIESMVSMVDSSIVYIRASLL